MTLKINNEEVFNLGMMKGLKDQIISRLNQSGIIWSEVNGQVLYMRI